MYLTQWHQPIGNFRQTNSQKYR